MFCVALPPREVHDGGKRIRDASNRRRGGQKWQRTQQNKLQREEEAKKASQMDKALEIMGSLARSLERKVEQEDE